jgi:hypothetical protein
MSSLFDLTGKVAVASRKLEHLEKATKEIEAKGRKTLAVSVDVAREKFKHYSKFRGNCSLLFCPDKRC